MAAHGAPVRARRAGPSAGGSAPLRPPSALRAASGEGGGRPGRPGGRLARPGSGRRRRRAAVGGGHGRAGRLSDPGQAGAGWRSTWPRLPEVELVDPAHRGPGPAAGAVFWQHRAEWGPAGRRVRAARPRWSGSTRRWRHRARSRARGSGNIGRNRRGAAQAGRRRPGLATLPRPGRGEARSRGVLPVGGEHRQHPHPGPGRCTLGGAWAEGGGSPGGGRLTRCFHLLKRPGSPPRPLRR